MSSIAIALSIILHQFLPAVTIELVFVSFVLSGVFFFLSRTDSRLLILPAILLLWLCAFLLAFGFEIAAEEAAIYAYYFLVVGVILQFTEYKLQYKIKYDLSLVKDYFYQKKTLSYALLWFAVFIVSLFLEKDYLRPFSLFFATTLFIGHSLRYVLKNETDKEAA